MIGSLSRATRRTMMFGGSAALAAALVFGAGTATAAPDATPNWSGLDARTYSGTIPARAGELITETTLDPSLSIPGAGSAYRILYSTPDVHDRMALSTGAVFLPEGEAPAGGWPIIAWAHGTTGLGDDCTPSALPRSPRDRAYLGHWLEQGYAVASTDYVGLGTPGLMSYLNGETEAHSIVDSVKAAHQMGLPLADRWALVGQSQGAGAALAAAHQATALSRGTDLDYRGVVATGTPANLEQILAFGGPQFPPVALPAGLNAYVAYILAGFTDARPDMKVESILTPFGKDVLRQAATLCLDDMSDYMDGKKLSTMFARPIESLPNARAALADYMGTPYKGYDRPIFLGQGLLDTDVPAPSALSLYAQMKANNQPVTLHVYPEDDHSSAVLASIPDSTPWLARLMR